MIYVKNLFAICRCLTNSEFSLSLAYRQQNPPANGKQGPEPDEMFQILTNE
jgi:hypothetical protein